MAITKNAQPLVIADILYRLLQNNSDGIEIVTPPKVRKCEMYPCLLVTQDRQRYKITVKPE